MIEFSTASRRCPLAIEFIRAFRDAPWVQEIFEPNLLPRGVTLEISLGASLEPSEASNAKHVSEQSLPMQKPTCRPRFRKGTLVIGIPAKASELSAAASRSACNPSEGPGAVSLSFSHCARARQRLPA